MQVTIDIPDDVVASSGLRWETTLAALPSSGSRSKVTEPESCRHFRFKSPRLLGPVCDSEWLGGVSRTTRSTT